MPRTTNEIGKLGVDLGNSGNSWWVYYGELPCYCCFFSCFFPQDAKLEDRESTPHCPKFLPYTQRSWQIPWVILRITRLPDSLWIICLVVSAIKVCANTLRNNQKLCQVLATANFDLLCTMISSRWFAATSTGWWFGTFFIVPYIGNNNPNWLVFFRGIETTNQSNCRNCLKHFLLNTLFLEICPQRVPVSSRAEEIWWLQDIAVQQSMTLQASQILGSLVL